MFPTGYRLSQVRGGIRPFRLHYCARTRSTSDLAARLRRRGELFAPAAVLCTTQTAGRGRGKNAWLSPPGCITVTFVVPVEEHLAPQQLSLVAGLAVRNAAAEITGNDGIALKWPNDVIYHGRKLAGVLCERINNADLVGIGLNVNLNERMLPMELRGRVTSMASIAGRPLDLSEALCTLAGHLHRTLDRRKEHQFASLLKEYDRHHALVGQRVTVTGSDESEPVGGRCDGLDSVGRLLVRGHDRLFRVVAGTVVVG